MLCSIWFQGSFGGRTQHNDTEKKGQTLCPPVPTGRKLRCSTLLGLPPGGGPTNWSLYMAHGYPDSAVSVEPGYLEWFLRALGHRGCPSCLISGPGEIRVGVYSGPENESQTRDVVVLWTYLAAQEGGLSSLLARASKLDQDSIQKRTIPVSHTGPRVTHTRICMCFYVYVYVFTATWLLSSGSSLVVLSTLGFYSDLFN